MIRDTTSTTTTTNGMILYRTYHPPTIHCVEEKGGKTKWIGNDIEGEEITRGGAHELWRPNTAY